MWKFFLLGALVVVFTSDWASWVSKSKSTSSTIKSNGRPKGRGSNMGIYPNFKMGEDGYYTYVLDIRRTPDPLHVDDKYFSMEQFKSHNLSGWMNVSTASIKGLSKMVNVIRVRPGPKEWNIELVHVSPFIEIDGMYEALIFYETDRMIFAGAEVKLQQPKLHPFIDKLVNSDMMKIEGLTVNGKGNFGLFFKNFRVDVSATIPSEGKAKLLSLETHLDYESMNLDMQNGLVNDVISINELWNLWNSKDAVRTLELDKKVTWQKVEAEFASCYLENFNKQVEDCTLDELRTFFFFNGASEFKIINVCSASNGLYEVRGM